MEERARKRPEMIDPSKFVGGKNVERLKSLLQDVESFAKGVKPKLEQAEEIINRFGDVVTKFDENMTVFGKLILLNGEALERMKTNMQDSINKAFGGEKTNDGK